MTRSRLVQAALVVAAALLGMNARQASAQTQLTQTAIYNIPEANQGIGVDRDFFYAIDNRTIAKYTKNGRLVGKWEGPADGPIVHLDSAAVIDGKIYCSHSNYRVMPMTSSIEVWDAKTLDHIASHSLGIQFGSLTWLDKLNGEWYGTFANYDRTGQLPDGSESGVPYGGKINTTLARFDKEWRVVEAWILPKALLDRFADMSNSGGSFGPDGNLYITGHDPAEVYKVRFPEAGSVIEVDEIIPANIRGQGIAWDRSQAGVLYGIIRATSAEEDQGIGNKVVVFKSNLRGRPPRPRKAVTP